MNFIINEAVIQAIAILCEDETITIEKECSYPGISFALQDMSDKIYQDSISRLFFRITDNFAGHPDQLIWQLCQLYRILNAAVYSIHPSMTRHKAPLAELLAQVEQTPQVQAWFATIAARQEPRELLCTGHGEMYLTDPCIKHFHGCQLVTYAPVGAMLDFKTAAAIENDAFDKSLVIITDCVSKKTFRPRNYSFPKIVDQKSRSKTQEMWLTSDDKYRARVIDKITGRVLLESKESIALSKLMKEFPHSILHWLVCSTVYVAANNFTALTPNANYLVNYSNKENLSIFPQEEYLQKLRSSTSQLKLDQSFSLFNANAKRRGELNPELKKELKRRKLPNPRLI